MISDNVWSTSPPSGRHPAPRGDPFTGEQEGMYQDGQALDYSRRFGWSPSRRDRRCTGLVPVRPCHRLQLFRGQRDLPDRCHRDGNPRPHGGYDHAVCSGAAGRMPSDGPAPSVPPHLPRRHRGQRRRAIELDSWCRHQSERLRRSRDDDELRSVPVPRAVEPLPGPPGAGRRDVQGSPMLEAARTLSDRRP